MSVNQNRITSDFGSSQSVPLLQSDENQGENNQHLARDTGFGTNTQAKLSEMPHGSITGNMDGMAQNLSPLSNNADSNRISSDGKNSLFTTKKVNFKHGSRLQTDVNDATLLQVPGQKSTESKATLNASSQRTHTQSSGTQGVNTRETAMTAETIDVQIDRQALEARNEGRGQALQRIVQGRNASKLSREAHQHCLSIIENDSDLELLAYLKKNSDIFVCDIISQEGKSLLHECTFNDSVKCLKALLNLAKEQANHSQMATWINTKDNGDGFVALHFASFKGNPDACELLIDHGADIYAKNNFGINMLHVAAQGDQPISIYFFKLRGLDLRGRDNRGSTPLHWAAYSQAEITLVYLLSWVTHLDDQDCDGFTPLHLAVKSVESLKSTRPVRSLLIRGASRDAVDNQDRKPIDLAEFVTTPHLRQALAQDLAPPKEFNCLMLKTPLKLVKKSLKTPSVMWILMSFIYAVLLLQLFPLYYKKQPLIYIQLSLFALTVIMHVLCLTQDPGYLKRPKGVLFMDMMKIFDPVLLCADCEVIRTDRSRHCSICNKCVERFDHHCPWINNCVGVNNHGIFMSFLISVFALLFVTLISLCLNFSCYNNFNNVNKLRNSDNFLYTDLFLPDWCYEKAFVISMTILCISICSLFLMLVTLLTGVQLRNFCLNRTTSERFGKAKVVQESRTSTYLESQGGESFIDDDELSTSILEAMQTRDYTGRSCAVVRNCSDMCCLRQHPDQQKIYTIQAGKKLNTTTECEQGLLLTLKDDGDGLDRKSYDKTPKPRRTSKVGEEYEIFEDRRDTGASQPSINSSQKQRSSNKTNVLETSIQVDSRHSLNFEQRDDDY